MIIPPQNPFLPPNPTPLKRKTLCIAYTIGHIVIVQAYREESNNTALVFGVFAKHFETFDHQDIFTRNSIPAQILSGNDKKGLWGTFSKRCQMHNGPRILTPYGSFSQDGENDQNVSSSF